MAPISESASFVLPMRFIVRLPHDKELDAVQLDEVQLDEV
jgi:hypothetical protein